MVEVAITPGPCRVDANINIKTRGGGIMRPRRVGKQIWRKLVGSSGTADTPPGLTNFFFFFKVSAPMGFADSRGVSAGPKRRGSYFRQTDSPPCGWGRELVGSPSESGSNSFVPSLVQKQHLCLRSGFQNNKHLIQERSAPPSRPPTPCCSSAAAVAARAVWSSDEDADVAVDAGNGGGFAGDEQGDLLLRVYPGGDEPR